MIAAGRFRTLGVVQRIKSDATADASGRVDLTDSSNWYECWRGKMEVLAITAKERVYAQQPVHDITHRVTIRKSEKTAAIKARDRVKVGSRILNITGVIEVGNPARLIELSCLEER